ncbi:MAG: UDP-N-acetylmuramate--L-alanine ligase [Prevotellaceae bacterium]|nr:UDP-N-acetylmuramate--L-alanine ligase [Prevotellaceae bacterium]
MNKNKMYFIGIGGIGMSALARYFKHEGLTVAGYDRTPSSLTASLEAEGMDIHYGEDEVELIPDEFKHNKDSVGVIYTPAVPAVNAEYRWFADRGYEIIKRSAALGFVARNKKTLAVAGTHGKTTVSTLAAHLLTQAGDKGCTAFLGGIAKNYESNLLLSSSEWLVAEADEYDRSFLQLHPQAAVITSADADHLDIYGTEDELRTSFAEFASQVASDGALILKQGIDLPLYSAGKQSPKCKIYHYSLDEVCDFYASNIRYWEGGRFIFDMHTPFGELFDCTLGIPARINIENAVAASALALYAGADPEKLKLALASFRGVKRRFDFYINTPELVYLDDYAHHPEELKAAILSLRGIFPGRRITAIFQPHLYTRTRDFAAGFAKSLSLLDELIMLEIYPARELPIEGVSSKIIFDRVTASSKLMCSKDELLGILAERNLDVLVTFGAGDIDRLTEPIFNQLKIKMDSGL